MRDGEAGLQPGRPSSRAREGLLSGALPTWHATEGVEGRRTELLLRKPKAHLLGKRVLRTCVSYHRSKSMTRTLETWYKVDMEFLVICGPGISFKHPT